MSDAEFSDDDLSSPTMTGGDSVSPEMDGNRRAHHNALERKRRDHIKDSFTTLKEKLPMLEGERSSRALILKKAVDYVALMRSKIDGHQLDIDELKRQNDQLEAQIKSFETISDIANANHNIPATQRLAIAPSSPPPLPTQRRVILTKASVKSMDGVQSTINQPIVPIVSPPSVIASPIITTTASIIHDHDNQLNMRIIHQQQSLTTGRLPYGSLTLPLIPASTPSSIITDVNWSNRSSASGRPTIAGQMITSPLTTGDNKKHQQQSNVIIDR